MHSLDSILPECYRTLDSLKIPYNKNHTIVLSSRLKRCWGSCRKNPEGTYTIKISPVLLEDTTPVDSLRDTIFHELLHTVPNAMSHGKTWQQLAQRVNRATGLNIKRSTPASEKGISQDFAADPSVKLLCVCRGCGAEIVRYRKCDFARRISRYRCGRCGGTFQVVINRFS